MSTVLSVAETTQKWAEQRGIATVFTKQTGSTNDDAKKNALGEGDDLVIYVTEHQTAGRGRGTNTWLDTGSGEGLLSTWSIKMESSPQAITGPRIGLAVFFAACSVWPSLEWSLKAPNDLFLNGHKVGGLLVETVSSGAHFRLIIGIGINVLNHPRRFNQAEHISKTLHSAPEEGEWFQFLDELRDEFSKAALEITNPSLSEAACAKLLQALNANSAKPFTIQQVTPQGDLIHSKGKVKWIDL